jgi:hypothetical protein
VIALRDMRPDEDDAYTVQGYEVTTQQMAKRLS